LWHGRFGTGPAEELVAFTESLSYDQRLIFSDIACSKAHVRGLAHSGLITEEEMGAILGGLDTVEMEYRAGDLQFLASDEDIHTAIERRVTEVVGEPGGKLHTGRSRNDQVATAFRHHLLGEIDQVAARLLAFVEVLVKRADEAGTSDGASYLPGYTHLQQAQPVLLAHHLMAHAWTFLRDLDRLGDCRARVDVSPLGAGALAGSSLPLDPSYTAERAGFSAHFENSLDAVSDRDFAAEILFVLTLIGLHLSRLGEEVVLWSSAEFGFVSLDDRYSTGSSMLPQKKNPDIAELARGKSGRLIGDLAGLLATMKSLPIAYNRDLQEDKEPVFDALDTVKLGLGAMAGMYATLVFNAERMADSADSEYGGATDLAEFLVRGGTPFRSAHAIVGALVRDSVESLTPLRELVAADERLGPQAAKLLERGESVKQRTTPGGAGPVAVAAQRVRLAEVLEQAHSTWHH
jgi:argininosuccinate lyase